MDINRGILKQISNCDLIGNDFLTDSQGLKNTFDRVVANPPFSKNQDIEHIYKMFEVCRQGGKIVTIASKHWQHSTGKKETAFKQWLEDLNADVIEVPSGEFAESGTKIATCIIIINKP
jgi:type I restriction-modification system DNA methylase subunit